MTDAADANLLLVNCGNRLVTVDLLAVRMRSAEPPNETASLWENPWRGSRSGPCRLLPCLVVISDLAL
jgi:hypothetical protein